MIPAVFVGLFLKEQLERFFSGNVFWVGVMLLVTGTILLWSDRQGKTTQDITSKKAAILGVVQAIAIMPGISRSGSTIGASILLGIDRSKAATFSFLMVIPLIFGAMLNEIKDYDTAVSNSQQIAGMPALAGFLAAAITGYFACKWMVELVKRSKLSYFAYYCFALGVISIVLGVL
jgi:undecaprenyl-diphosphatase